MNCHVKDLTLNVLRTHYDLMFLHVNEGNTETFVLAFGLNFFVVALYTVILTYYSSQI